MVRERFELSAVSDLGMSHWRNEAGLVAAIFVVLLVTVLISDPWREQPVGNAQTLLLQTALLGTFALGAAVVIVAGGIDLSSGSVISFSAAVCCSILLLLAPVDETGPQTSDLAWWAYAAAFFGTLLSAVLIGSFHTWLITVVGLPPFVATLASLVGLRSLARGLVPKVTALRMTGGSPPTQIYIHDRWFHHLANNFVVPLIVLLCLAAVMWLLMSRTVVGRHIYALGGNEEAARLSGIRTDRLKWLVYCLAAVTASIAGILYASYEGKAHPATQGLGYELDAIAAAVVGGCSLQGGIGKIPGVVLGALFLQVVIDSVAKTVRTSPDEFQGLIVGILIVIAVAFNELRGRGGLQKQFFAGGLGFVAMLNLTILSGLIVLLLSKEHPVGNGLLASGCAAALLIVRKAVEFRAAKR